MKQKKTTIRMISVTLALVFCVLSLSIGVGAADFEGKGTVSSPYLVKTAEQLNNMRNNLSAHYKLSNTIDMSSFGEFTPIGILSRPFTGSFTCDLNSDGSPKYIIKNLTVYNRAGEKNNHEYNKVQSDYAKDNSKWETGLFGAVSGSTVKGIYILNAKVTSTVIGQEDMNNDKSLNYGQKDEQGTAVLIGIAKSANVSNCFVSGTVNSASNCTGGLIGAAYSSCKVKNCGAQTDINASGVYYTAAFIGRFEGGTVSNCFSTGNVTMTNGNGAAAHHMAGFICRCNDATVTNCYSTGSTAEGQSFMTSTNEATQVSNCYATGAVTGITHDWSGFTTDSGYISNAAGCFQKGFAAKSEAEILKAFEGKSGWSASGNLPTLTGVAIVNADSYNPEAVTVQPGATQTASQAQTNAVESSDSVSSQVTDANEIVELINSLPDDTDELTIDMKDDIKKAKRACDGLSDADFASFPTEAITKINTIYEAFGPLLLSDVAERIQALPEAESLTAEDVEAVKEILDDLDFLPEEVRSMLSKELQSKIEAAEKAIEEISGDANTLVVEPEKNEAQIILIIVLAVIAVLLLAAIVVMIIFYFKTIRIISDTVTDDLEDI